MNKNGKKILVVDDEVKIVDAVKSYLEKSGFVVAAAYSGSEAFQMAVNERPALIILDLMLPDVSGEEICRQLRRESDVPIIMLTAKADEENILNGLNLGADDYITKPFSPRQLIARVDAVLRRSDRQPPEILTFNGGLLIDLKNYAVQKEGKPVGLTPNEYKILCAMAAHPNKVYTREELIFVVCGQDYEGIDRVIDTHIKNIRQKIETDTRNPTYIITVHGVGYRFGGIVR